jgi:hypothetical protein
MDEGERQRMFRLRDDDSRDWSNADRTLVGLARRSVVDGLQDQQGRGQERLETDFGLFHGRLLLS